MRSGLSRRGQPLLALILLMCGWVSARAMMWEPRPVPHLDGLSLARVEIDRLLPARDLADSESEAKVGDPAGISYAPIPGSIAPREVAVAPMASGNERSAPPRAVGREAELYPQRPVDARPSPRRVALPPAPPPIAVPVRTQMAVGHQLLWMAALARVPLPASLAGFPGEPGAGDTRIGSSANPDRPAAQRRWSVDGWILWRRGSLGAANGGLLTPSYGASQAGAVIRYRLAPSSGMRPAAYLRTTAALNGSSEREAALGLQLRPVPRVPLAIYGEARLTAIPGQTYVRPAVFAVTELPQFALPMGLRGEVYGQAGYVGGRNATAFADGQLRVDRRLFGIGRGDLRLGGGLWGGAQKGASRLDAGPTLTIGQPLGQSSSMRLAADWRFRVAGKAAPGSGPAVTLSAGF